MKFVLKTGLTLRIGERALEVVRLLGDDEVQLEDVLTRRPSVLTRNELLKRIWTGRYVIAHGGHTCVGVLDKRLADGTAAIENALPSAVDIGALPTPWREQIEFRLAYIKSLKAAHVRRGERGSVTRVIQAMAAKSGTTKPPSSSSVMRWARQYELAGHNPLALLSSRKLRSAPNRTLDAVEAAISSVLKKEYFTAARHSLVHAHDCLRRELKGMVKRGEISEAQSGVSKSTLQRRVAAIDKYRRIASREGDARARYVCRTSMDGGAASYPLQRVEVDHTPLNWVVICDRTGLPLGRPLLTVAIDAFSNYVLGFYLSFYGAGVSSVTGVLRNAFAPKDDLIQGLDLTNRWLSHGLADEWVLDNGLEFHAQAFKTIFWQLGIDITYCRVRTPWLKPHVERFFNSLNWIGLTKGRVREVTPNVVSPDPYRDASIRFSDLVAGLTKFVVDVLPFTVNNRKLARPYDLFLEGLERCPPASFPGSIDELRMISGLSKVLTVHQGGVDLLGLPYGGPELLPLRKRHGGNFRTLCKWDPDDLSHLFVQDPADPTSWVTSPCRWMEYAGGLSWNQHRLIRAARRKDLLAKGAEEALWAARLQLHDHWLNATRPTKKADSLLAGRFAGLTSSKVFEGAALEAPAPSRLLPLEVNDRNFPLMDIPEFDTFQLAGR